MSKATAKLDRSTREGHGGDLGHRATVKKGAFIQVGEQVGLATEAISPNRKSGSSSGGEQ